MDLRRQLAVVRSWWPLLLVSMLLAGAVAYVVTSAQEKVYEARTTLIVGQSLSGVNPDYTQLLVSQRLSTTYAAIATTEPILNRVIQRLHLDESAEQLARRVEATAAPDSSLLSIVVDDSSADRAAAIANAIAEGLIAASPSLQGDEADLQAAVVEDLAAVREQIRQAQAEVDALTVNPERTPADDARLETLQARLISLRSTYAELLSLSATSAANLLSVVQPASAPDTPVAPRPALTALIAAIVGLLIAGAIAFIADSLNDAVKTADEVQEAVGLPTLGTIERMKGTNQPELYRLATLVYPRSSAAEAYRTLRANIEFAAIDQPIRTLLITSALPSEGKTVTAANLAMACAQNDQRVLLVDADLRRPGVHEIFGVPNEHGLTSLIRSGSAALESIVSHTESDHLDLLTTGPIPPNPAELLGSQRMRSVLGDLEAAYDLVVLDTAPLRIVADAAVLSTFVGGVILVVDASKSRRGSLREAHDTLRRAQATILGAVINGVKAPVRSDYYHYETEDRPPDDAPKGSKVPSAAAAESSQD